MSVAEHSKRDPPVLSVVEILCFPEYAMRCPAILPLTNLLVLTVYCDCAVVYMSLVKENLLAIL